MVKGVKLKVGIIGASGYTGAELLRILEAHPQVEVAYITAHTYAGSDVAALYSHLHAYAGYSFEEYSCEEALKRADLHFIALPHGESMRVVPSLLEGGARVVDLSADYRLSNPELYGKWYGLEHTSPMLLKEAVYGMPEILEEDSIRDARLVAVAGCYPTAVILALAPLAQAGYLNSAPAIVDAKSGLSGAGRSLSLATHFAQADESVRPYNVGAHRHTPEMEQVLSALAGTETSVFFAPHLVPMSRGILATCYVQVGSDVPAEVIAEVYGAFYDGNIFVVLKGEGCYPETKAVCGSNYCHLGWLTDSRSGVLTVVSAIDNLVKGASGQAVQCLNIMQGWPEDMGLAALGIFP
jgi:N-acetyl-gamma-glutamyl-phosphate reductase